MTLADLEKAKALAHRAHDGQVDKGGQPYVLHPLRVARTVPEGIHQVVALLHDVVEDSDITIQEIAYDFGSEVADAVDCLTRRSGELYAQFIARCGANAVARIVKMADLQDNMNDARLPPPLSEKDHLRLVKYGHAYRYLKATQKCESDLADLTAALFAAKPTAKDVMQPLQKEKGK